MDSSSSFFTVTIEVTIAIAIDKTYTSAAIGISTAEEVRWRSLEALNTANSLCGGRIVILGGVPAKAGNVTVGAVGCSSGTVEQNTGVTNRKNLNQTGQATCLSSWPDPYLQNFSHYGSHLSGSRFRVENPQPL